MYFILVMNVFTFTSMPCTDLQRKIHFAIKHQYIYHNSNAMLFYSISTNGDDDKFFILRCFGPCFRSSK